MIRVILLRLLVCSWAIPSQYILLLPFFYLCFGDFKKELSDMNDMNLKMWKGEL